MSWDERWNRSRIVLVLVLAAVLTALAVNFINQTVGATQRTNKSGDAGQANWSLMTQSPLQASSASLSASAGNEGVAALQPLNKSGIQALLQVQKIGRTQTVTGFATGMDPYKAYVSFFDDAGASQCACASGNTATGNCSAQHSAPVNFSQTVVGYWLPLIGSSTRTLHILKAGSPEAPGGAAFLPLEHISSISIREDTQLGQPLPAASDATRFQWRACGKFQLNR